MVIKKGGQMTNSLIKKISISIIVILMIMVLVGCSTTSVEETSTQESKTIVEESVDVTMTLDELSKFDGKDGNLAYIAVDGVIYDVSSIPQWVGGMHLGFSAGKDVSQEVKDSPHGVSKLSNVPVIGNIVE